MTRPKKDESLTKTKDVHLRMSETEYEILSERATATNMTISDFIRNALNTQNIVIKYELTADVPEIKKLIGEFGKIGSNLNQIAKYFNQGGIISSEMRTEIKKSLLSGQNVIIAAHGNSLRALIKYLEDISNDDIMNVEIPTGKPYVYELDDNLNIINKYYL